MKNNYPSKSNIFFIVVIGVINTSPYSLLLSGSQDIANHFQKPNLTAAISLGLIIFSAATVFCNSKFFLKVAHKKRILTSIIYSCLGLLIYGLVTLYNDTWLLTISVGACIMVGIGQALG